MPTYYKATFSDGTVVKRTTTHPRYTHAWISRRQNNADTIARGYGETSQSHGFSASEVNASNQLRRYCWGTMLMAEVAPAVEITGQEYRALKTKAK